MRKLVFVLMLALPACAARQPAAPEPAVEDAVPRAHEPAPAAALEESSNPVEAVPLQVVMTDQTTTGRVMKLRGKLVNPHEEQVVGARVQLVFVAPSADGGVTILEMQQKEIDSTMPPGGSAVLRWDVESLYLSPMGQFIVAAYPKRLGDKDMPPPDHWKE